MGSIGHGQGDQEAVPVLQESRDGVSLVEFQVRLALDVTGMWDC